jgi:ferredoxin
MARAVHPGEPRAETASAREIGHSPSRERGELAQDTPTSSEPRWLARPELQRLLDALRAAGWRVLGPVVRDHALVFEEIHRVEELPVGWRDEQAPGRYRLARDGSPRVFGVVHGPGGIKAHTFAPREVLLEVEMDGASGPGRPFSARTRLPAVERIALLGVRACDLAGLLVQDRIFLRDRFPDPHYAARRDGLLLVAVGCTRAVDTCFCASMDTGPAPRGGYDLALTELDEGGGGFVVRSGSEAGAALLAGLALPAAAPARLAREEAAYAACTEGMRRALPREGLRDLLFGELEHPRWDDVAARCLSCGNCTLVCPTCFCHDVRDEPALDGRGSLRVREWDSCFNLEHAQVHGTNFRPRIRDRYRQWLVHKLAGWIDQFDVSGCVGCGRCITWCPVGIDLTEEVAAIAASRGAKAS